MSFFTLAQSVNLVFHLLTLPLRCTDVPDAGPGLILPLLSPGVTPVAPPISRFTLPLLSPAGGSPVDVADGLTLDLLLLVPTRSDDATTLVSMREPRFAAIESYATTLSIDMLLCVIIITDQYCY